MPDNSYTKICKTEALRENVGIKIRIQQKDIGIFKINGEIFAVSNVCPHNRASVLHNGQLTGYEITCPHHGWVFDLKTGECLKGYKEIHKYDTIIENGEIWIKLKD